MTSSSGRTNTQSSDTSDASWQMPEQENFPNENSGLIGGTGSAGPSTGENDVMRDCEELDQSHARMLTTLTEPTTADVIVGGGELGGHAPYSGEDQSPQHPNEMHRDEEGEDFNSPDSSKSLSEVSGPRGADGLTAHTSFLKMT